MDNLMTAKTNGPSQKKLLLLLEDDDRQCRLLKASGTRYFGNDPDCNILEAKNVKEAVLALSLTVSGPADTLLLADTTKVLVPEF